MKLPKPGKNRIPKPGARKLPELGKIHIKNRFLQKNLFSLIVIAVLAIGTGTAYGTLSSKDADMGPDPVAGVNPDRYQVLISGEGFKLSKKQEKDYKLQKKQNQVNAANAAQDSNTFRYSNGFRVFRSGGSYRYRYNTNTYKPSKTPRVMTNITEQISMESNWRAGDTLKFRVSAYAYPYGVKNTIPAKSIKVSVAGGKEAKLYRETDGYCYYSVELGKGKNKITITATDKKTKKLAKLGPYIIKAGKGKSSDSHNSDDSNTDPTKNTDNPSTEAEKETETKPATETKTRTVAVSVSYGDGGVIDLSGDIDENKTLLEALQEMGVTVSGSKIEYVPGDFFIEELDEELRAKYRKDNNLADNEEIDGPYSEWLAEEGIADKIKDGVGKNHPFSTTYWTCESDLNTKVKDLSSDVKLTLVLYED